MEIQEYPTGLKLLIMGKEPCAGAGIVFMRAQSPYNPLVESLIRTN
jgi:hypothetical protein